MYSQRRGTGDIQNTKIIKSDSLSVVNWSPIFLETSVTDQGFSGLWQWKGFQNSLRTLVGQWQWSLHLPFIGNPKAYEERQKMPSKHHSSPNFRMPWSIWSLTCPFLSFSHLSGALWPRLWSMMNLLLPYPYPPILILSASGQFSQI